MQTIPASYAEQLRADYDQAIADQLVDPEYMQFAPLRHQPGETVPFVVVESLKTFASPEPAPSKKILYIPGFGEGIVNKASFAAELAEGGRDVTEIAKDGRDVILPGQNRHDVIKDEMNRPSSLLNQALNYLAVLEAAVGDEPVDIVPHSYGVQIFDAMVRIAPERFKDSKVAILAPSGSIEDQELPAMGAQWLRMMKSEADQSRPMTFPDKKNVTGMASARVLLANIRRTLLEVGDLWRRNVDYKRIAEAVGSVAVLTYAEDEMFPEYRISPVLTKAVRAGLITWAMPSDSKGVLKGKLAYGGEGAVHDDEQYNPHRVAAAVLEFLS